MSLLSLFFSFMPASSSRRMVFAGARNTTSRELRVKEDLFMDLKQKRWYILVAALVINFCIGSGYAWSVFARPLTLYFSNLFGTPVAAASVSLAFVISSSIGPVTMISGGWLQDKFGPKWVMLVGGVVFGGGIALVSASQSLGWLYFAYGIMAGLGMGAVYSCTIANTVKFFPDKRGLVAGLSTAAYGLGSVVTAPVAVAMIGDPGDTGGNILGTFRTLGLIFLVIIVLGSLVTQKAPVGYIPEGWTPPAPSPSAAVTGVNKTWTQVLSDPIFYVMLLMLTCGAFSGLMITSQASPIALNAVGVSSAVAGFAVSLLGISNMCGRLFWGAVSDKLGRTNSLIVMYVLAAIAALVLRTVAFNEFAKYVVAVMFVGFCFGGTMGVFPAFTADMFGPVNNGVNYGWMFCGFAIAGYFGPQIVATTSVAIEGAELGQAATISYGTPFLISTIFSIAGIALTLVFVAMKKARATSK
jgi:MFS family permease